MRDGRKGRAALRHDRGRGRVRREVDATDRRTAVEADVKQRVIVRDRHHVGLAADEERIGDGRASWIDGRDRVAVLPDAARH